MSLMLYCVSRTDYIFIFLFRNELTCEEVKLLPTYCESVCDSRLKLVMLVWTGLYGRFYMILPSTEQINYVESWVVQPVQIMITYIFVFLNTELLFVLTSTNLDFIILIETLKMVPVVFVSWLKAVCYETIWHL